MFDGGSVKVPYDEDYVYLIYEHLIALTHNFPTLSVRLAEFYDFDGSNLQLLQADGTIPIGYGGSFFNVPVTIWLLLAYPMSAPRVFLSPTADMEVRREHKHVDYGTLTVCNFPYIDDWKFPESNVSDLVLALSNAFGNDPPVFSRSSSREDRRIIQSMGESSRNSPLNNVSRPRYQGSSSTSSSSPSSSTSSSSSSSTSSSSSPSSSSSSSTASSSSSSPSSLSSSSSPSSSSSSPPPPPPPIPSLHGHIPYSLPTPSPDQTPSIPLSRQSPSGNDESTNTCDVFRENAIRALSERTELDIENQRRILDAETNKFADSESLLQSRELLLIRALDQQREERDAVEQQLQYIRANTDVVEAWLKNQIDFEDVSIDDIFTASDELSKQLLESSAADLALDDVLYTLDKAVQHGCMPLDEYLRRVRLAAREQFLHRAMSSKLEAIQRDRRISNMAARHV
ncbi:hypothetical protein KP509_05G091900 [Ceratopteris richardii]|nr:hypothetical protein KP509_05G091900 [Ceratopteris richardii]